MSEINALANAWEGQNPMPAFMAIMARWGTWGRKFRDSKYQAALLGITEDQLRALIAESGSTSSEEVHQRISAITNIANRLVCLFNYPQLEVKWLESKYPVAEELRSLTGESGVAKYLMSHGLTGYRAISAYLENTLKRINANDHYLLCLGVCNTLIEIPTMYTDTGTESLAVFSVCNQQDPSAIIRNAIDVAPSLQNSIPLGDGVMLLKRPYLQELVDFIKQQPSLDVAIITSATREYVNTLMGKAAPELLSLCKFIWTREDHEKFLVKVTQNEFYKTLQNIPELMGYRLGRVLMMEHNKVVPHELHLAIQYYEMNTTFPDVSAGEKLYH